MVAAVNAVLEAGNKTFGQAYNIAQVIQRGQQRIH